MQTSPVTPEQLNSSVIAVPPLARDAELKINREENGKIIRHIEAGGVATLLYGGNANFYHIAPSEYAEALEIISTESAENTLIVPSVGPAYGTMMDQITTLRNFNFPTVMVLPMQGLTTDTGVANGFRKFVETLGQPAVLYIKFEGYLEPETVAQLVNEGLVLGSNTLSFGMILRRMIISHDLSRWSILDLLSAGSVSNPRLPILLAFRLTASHPAVFVFAQISPRKCSPPLTTASSISPRPSERHSNRSKIFVMKSIPSESFTRPSPPLALA